MNQIILLFKLIDFKLGQVFIIKAEMREKENSWGQSLRPGSEGLGALR